MELVNNLISEIWQPIQQGFGVEQDYRWMLIVALVMMLTAVASLLARWGLVILSKLMGRTNTRWDDIFLKAVKSPLKGAIWIVGIAIAAQVSFSSFTESEMKMIPALRDAGIVLMIGWSLLRYIRLGSRLYIEKRQELGESYDYTSVQAIAKILKISVLIATGLIVLQNLGISVSGVLAFGGIGGIAVGFAAKDMLANFFGALIIYFDKPFKVGDWIRSPDQEIEGTVEEIGWRMTTIRTFDKRPLYVPNSIFTTISVENPSRMTCRRIYETVGIRYDDIAQMKAITQAVREMLIAHEDIDDKQTMIVHFNAFNASSCDFMVYTFTHTTNWVEFHAIKEHILLNIADIIAEHDAEMAFPTRTLHFQPTEVPEKTA